MTTHEIALSILALPEFAFADESSLRDAEGRCANIEEQPIPEQHPRELRAELETLRASHAELEDILGTILAGWAIDGTLLKRDVVKAKEIRARAQALTPPQKPDSGQSLAKTEQYGPFQDPPEHHESFV